MYDIRPYIAVATSISFISQLSRLCFAARRAHVLTGMRWNASASGATRFRSVGLPLHDTDAPTATVHLGNAPIRLCPLLSSNSSAAAWEDDGVVGSHPGGEAGQRCLQRLLQRMAASPRGCMRRVALGRPAATASVPIFVAVVPQLRSRLEAITRRVAALGAADVTLIECANADTVAALSARERACIHPEGQPTRFQPATHVDPLKANGTLSLAIKHALAYADLLSRPAAHAALMLEDDAMVPTSLWQSLAPYRVPCDAGIFWLSAYRQDMRIKALGGMMGRRKPLVESSDRHADVHRHDSPNTIISTAGYLFFRSAARTMLSQPIRAPSDVALSLVNSTSVCVQDFASRFQPMPPPAACRFVPPAHQYGPKRWLFGQDNAPVGGLAPSVHQAI